MNCRLSIPNLEIQSALKSDMTLKKFPTLANFRFWTYSAGNIYVNIPKSEKSWKDFLSQAFQIRDAHPVLIDATVC
jgi:hypothetical protein